MSLPHFLTMRCIHMFFFLLVTFNYSLVSAIPILLLTMHGIQTFLVQIIIMDNGRVQHQGSPYDIARADHDLEVKWKEAVRRASVTEDVRTAESSTEMERKSLRRQCSRKFSVVSHTDSVIGKLKPNTIFFTYTESPWEKAIEQLQMSYKLMDTSSPPPLPQKPSNGLFRLSVTMHGYNQYWRSKCSCTHQVLLCLYNTQNGQLPRHINVCNNDLLLNVYVRTLHSYVGYY